MYPKTYVEKEKEHSRKLCWCGGHNMKNVKSNLHHDGTRRRLQYRLAAINKLKTRYEMMIDGSVYTNCSRCDPKDQRMAVKT